MRDCHDTQKASILSGVWLVLGDENSGPLWDMLPLGMLFCRSIGGVVEAQLRLTIFVF